MTQENISKSTKRLQKIDFDNPVEIKLRSVLEKTSHSGLESIYLMVIDFFLSLGNEEYELVFSMVDFGRTFGFKEAVMKMGSATIFIGSKK